MGDPNENNVYIIAEDDALFVHDFYARFQSTITTLNREEPNWDFLHVGYYDDDCCLKPIESSARELLCKPVQVYGLFGSALRPCGARALLQHLFPLDEQIDSAFARIYD